MAYEALDTSSLIAEVTNSTFCFKSKIKAISVKVLWEKLSDMIARTLKEQKGVLLPNLGSFVVGPVVGESKKKVRPAFKLLERFNAISQERGRHMIGGRAPIVQPSYTLLSTQSGIHKGATQRIVAELLQRLGVHILSGRSIKCEFPGLGTLLHNKAGRVEFVFHPLFMEHFEREHYSLIREMEPADVDSPLDNAMQRMGLRTPASADPSTGSAARGVTSAPPGTPLSGEVQRLTRLCKQADRIGSGTIPRSTMEGYLRDMRAVTSLVDGASMLDLLATYAYGKAKTSVLYTPFLSALQDKINAHTSQDGQGHANFPPPPSTADGYPAQNLLQNPVFQQQGPPPQNNNPQAGFQNQQQESGQHAQHDVSRNEYDHDGATSEMSFQGLVQQPHVQQGPQQYAGGGYQQKQAHAAYEYPFTPGQNQHPVPSNPHQQNGVYPGGNIAHPFDMNRPALQTPQNVYQQLNQQGAQPVNQQAPHEQAQHVMQRRPVTAWTDASMPQQDSLHYNQGALSPRSRSEYDNFNKLHFERLQQMRGPGHKRAVTPKVGEDPLNRYMSEGLEYGHGQAQSFHHRPISSSSNGNPQAAANVQNYGDQVRRVAPQQPAQLHYQAPSTAASSQPPYSPEPGQQRSQQQQNVAQDSSLASPAVQVYHVPGLPNHMQARTESSRLNTPNMPPSQSRPVTSQQAPPVPSSQQQQQRQQQANMAYAPSRPESAVNSHVQGAPMRGSRMQSGNAAPRSQTPPRMASPPRSYHHQSQVQHCLRDPGAAPPPDYYPQAHGYDARDQDDSGLSPRPRPRPPTSAPISYYDVQKAEGPQRQRLKAELASELQQGWARQIQARQEFEVAVNQAEKQGWPYNLTNQPTDKRPVSAISRPTVSPLRGSSYR